MNISKILHKEVEVINEVPTVGPVGNLYTFRFKVRGIFRIIGFSDKLSLIRLNQLGNFESLPFYERYNEVSRKRLFNAIVKYYQINK